MWFGLPATSRNPEVVRDLKLLANRNVLDPHRHYKKENRNAAIPQFSQVGTIIEGRWLRICWLVRNQQANSSLSSSDCSRSKLVDGNVIQL